MKKKRDPNWDEDMPVGPLRVFHDPRLPSPEEVARSLRKVKVTILIDQASLDFFKRRARRVGGKYQQIMREVLRHYVAHHASNEAA